MSAYTPNPIDTSNITLPSELKALTEHLAKSTHDHWALERLDAGWTYGASRNDDKKTHPGLVPYEELTEDEKEYDRRTAMETLKAIIALGYAVEQKSPAR